MRDAAMTDDEIEVSELVDRMDDADRAACLGTWHELDDLAPAPAKSRRA